MTCWVLLIERTSYLKLNIGRESAIEHRACIDLPSYKVSRQFQERSLHKKFILAGDVWEWIQLLHTISSLWLAQWKINILAWQHSRYNIIQFNEQHQLFLKLNVSFAEMVFIIYEWPRNATTHTGSVHGSMATHHTNGFRPFSIRENLSSKFSSSGPNDAIYELLRTKLVVKTKPANWKCLNSL